MQIKTINKIVRSKMEQWLNTLPKKIQKEVKPNILVSGGCIASLFLQEDVNDFDIYIQDIDVLVKLSEHYASMKNVSVLDGRKRLDYIEDAYPKYDDSLPNGGFEEDYKPELLVKLQNLKEDQVKLDVPGHGYAYIPTKEQVDKKMLCIPTFFSANAISLTDKIQIVLRFSGNHEEIHKNFDYVHATNYWTYKEGVVTNEKALISLLTRQLFYQGSLYPLTSIIRMKKFILRKWKISAGEMLKIMYQISELNLKDPRVMEDQLIGVDIAYFSDLIKLLSTKKPDSWCSKWISECIDKVFNEFDN